MGTMIAQKRVKMHIDKKENDDNQGVEDLINKQSNAIVAKNLERLLTKKWTEYPNSYVVLSKI